MSAIAGTPKLLKQEIGYLRAEIERLREGGTVELVKAMLEIERLTAALNEMRSRDERNGSLPPAYRMIIDDALEPKP